MTPAQSLIHPGFAKAASTFLQEWFRMNPHLRFAPDSIAGFRNVFQVAEAARRPLDRGQRYFVTSNELLGTGATIPYNCPLYSFRLSKGADLRQGQKDICRLLREMFPDSRVVIVTRGFSGIIGSVYSQYIKLGGRRDFRGYLDEYKEILVQWLDVDYNLRLYRDAFGDDRVFVFPYEGLKADPGSFLVELERFLDLEHFDRVPAVKNPALPPDRLYWYAWLSRHVVSPFADRFSLATAAGIYNFYGFKVVQRDRFGPAISLLGRVAPRPAALDFPDGYLDAFRGLAASLASDERYRTLGREYLFAGENGR